MITETNQVKYAILATKLGDQVVRLWAAEAAIKDTKAEMQALSMEIENATKES